MCQANTDAASRPSSAVLRQVDLEGSSGSPSGLWVGGSQTSLPHHRNPPSFHKQTGVFSRITIRSELGGARAVFHENRKLTLALNSPRRTRPTPESNRQQAQRTAIVYAANMKTAELNFILLLDAKTPVLTLFASEAGGYTYGLKITENRKERMKF